MPRKSKFAFLFLVVGLLVVGAGLSDSRVAAQAKDGEKGAEEPAKIHTVDGVTLNAVFYPGKSTSPTVIMLHPIGDGKSIKLEGWKELAKALQGAGYSVLIFDFRGHGDSTTVDAKEFWSVPANRKVLKNAKDPETVEVKQFIKSQGYLPVLVNDIAAVKAFLDRKHDANICNTSNTVIIGAEDGATLGAIWLNSEWYRFKGMTSMFNPNLIQVADKRAEGNDVVSAVFLSIKPSLGTAAVNPSRVLKNACKDNGMPAAFFYGAKDTKGKEIATAAEKALKVGKSKKHMYIGAAAIPDTSLVGAKLLKPSLEVQGGILDFLEKATGDRQNERDARNFQEAVYVWRNPLTGAVTPAKTKTDKLFKFDTYEKYMQ